MYPEDHGPSRIRASLRFAAGSLLAALAVTGLALWLGTLLLLVIGR